MNTSCGAETAAAAALGVPAARGTTAGGTEAGSAGDVAQVVVTHGG